MACLIEPFQVSELGSPSAGVLNKVLVQRGDEVKKGQVVAELNTNVDEATLQLRRAEAAYLGRVVERNADLYQRKLLPAGDYDEMTSRSRQAQLQVALQQAILAERAASRARSTAWWPSATPAPATASTTTRSSSSRRSIRWWSRWSCPTACTARSRPMPAPRSRSTRPSATSRCGPRSGALIGDGRGQRPFTGRIVRLRHDEELVRRLRQVIQVIAMHVPGSTRSRLRDMTLLRQQFARLLDHVADADRHRAFSPYGQVSNMHGRHAG